MKLIHKVEECAVYESNKHSYASVPLSLNPPVIKTFLLKITSSSSNVPETASALLSNIEKCILNAVHSHIPSSIKLTSSSIKLTPSSIKFKALKAVPLKSFIEDMHSQSMMGAAYTLTLKLLADIGTQLERIRAEHGLIIPFLSLEDIIVIERRNKHNNQYKNKGSHDDNHGRLESETESETESDTESESESEYVFIFMNAEKLVPAPNKKELIVDIPLKVNKHTSFLPAELPESALRRLPMRVTTTSWQYSLSALCIYALLQHKFKNGEDDIERVGRPFLHTSLYFCLKRCLKPDPEERVLLYV